MSERDSLAPLLGDAVTKSRILVVDDDEGLLGVLGKTLARAGFKNVRLLSDSRLVLAELKAFEPDILLLDLRMPHLDGFVVLRQVRNRVRPGELFPILVLSGELEEETKHRALLEGASDFLSKPYGAVEVILRIRNLLEARNLSLKWERQVEEQLYEIRVVQDGVADRLAMLAEFRDYRGGPHTRRVGEMAGRIAHQMGLGEAMVDVVRKAAPLHDIGKLAIPDEILMKQGALSLEEMDVVKTHTAIGARVLSGSSSPILQVGEEIALYHHEHWDGTGYTPGLDGEAIPLPARITTVADVFDALMHERPYKRAWTLEESVDQVLHLSGTKFDPSVVDAFTKVVSLEGLPLMELDPEMRELALPFEQHYARRNLK
jgi:putative two-component system response regulator